MNCQKCGGKARVFNTRQSDDEKNSRHIPEKYHESLPKPFTFRHHKCDKCGETFQSFELLSDSLDAYENTIKTKLKRKFLNQIVNFFGDI